jgi:5-methylcytosine-specific restriction protein A
MAEWPYSTRRWQRLRRRKLQANPLCECEECQAAPLALPADNVDHITPIEEGGEPFAWSNLQSLAHAHHSRKTRLVDQRGGRVPVRGVDPATGRPLDPQHWWNGSENL